MSFSAHFQPEDVTRPDGYRWTGKNGVTHYSVGFDVDTHDRVVIAAEDPARIRDLLAVLGEALDGIDPGRGDQDRVDVPWPPAQPEGGEPS